jgi:AbrB family looped-hinge helix DNA binding protein
MAKVSKKGQVTIPADVRRLLKLQPGDRVRFTMRSGSTVLLQAVPRERSPGVPGRGSDSLDET